MSLPSIVCLKSAYNDKYLRYHEEEAHTNGLLQFSGEKVTDSFAQFEVVTSSVGGGLVHLISRYTNQYLVRWSPDHNWITASADKFNKDQYNWACTLFKPIFLDGDTKKARLIHVQSGNYLCLWRKGAPFDSCLFAGSKEIDQDSADIFTIIDWTSLLKLPKNVAFKGENGKYLGPFFANGTPFLQFSYDNPNDPNVAQEVFTSADGTIMIKSKYYGKFWRLGADDWIVADLVEPGSGNVSAMFRVNAVDVNVVTLLNMNKTWYCKCYSPSDAQQNLLKAGAQSINEHALLQVNDLGK